MAKLPAIASIAFAVLLVSTCITLGYVFLLHSDSLVSPTAETAQPQPRPRKVPKLRERLQSIKERVREAVPVSLGGGPDPCKGTEDARDECKSWASSGECENNPSYMSENCKRSCNATPQRESG